MPSVAFVLTGAVALRVCGPYPGDVHDEKSLLAEALDPERLAGDPLTATGRPGAWQDRHAGGSDLEIDDVLTAAGVYFVQTFLHSPHAREAHLVVDADLPSSQRLNDEVVRVRPGYHTLRPNLSGPTGAGGPVELRAGWNELLIKLVHDGRPGVGRRHVLLSDGPRFFDGLYDIGRSAFPWS